MTNNLSITFQEPLEPGVLVSIVFEHEVADLALNLSTTDMQLVARAVKAQGFTGKPNEHLSVFTLEDDVAQMVLLIGGGSRANATDIVLQNIGAFMLTCLDRSGFDHASLSDSDPACAAHITYGAKLAAYRSERNKTRDQNDLKLQRLNVDCVDAEATFTPLDAISQGVYLARDLVTQAPNLMTPTIFAQDVKALEAIGLDVQILDEDSLTSLGMHALLAVGQGSQQPSCVVVMRWMGNEHVNEEELALVGKGVTFDSGGISIKSAFDMADMKGDMGGAAAVVGTMKTLALRKTHKNVVGIVGLAENLPGGNAMKPGDIVVSASGQTIEIRNTDCEGRMMLADLVWYTQEKTKAKTIIDLATLTGAAVGALGNEYGAVLGDDDLTAELITAGGASGEKLWRLPLNDGLDRLLKSEFADINNTPGSKAGASTAAHFIKRFVASDISWAHIDMAGMAYKATDRKPTNPTWATGFGPRLLTRWIEQHAS